MILNPCRRLCTAAIRITRIAEFVVIDGGKGQLSSALEVIRGLGLHELPVIGLAKREKKFLPKAATKALCWTGNRHRCI